MTAFVNTIYNHLAFRLCWSFLVQEGYEGQKSFNHHVYLVAMGDDNVFSVSSTYLDKFNEFTLPEAMSRIGLTYTPETKGVVGTNLRDISQVEFLKRSFRYDHCTCRYLAPLRLDVVLEIPYWTKDDPSLHETVVADNVRVSLEELSLYPRDTYVQFARPLISTYYRFYVKRLERESFESNFAFTLNKDEWF